MRFAWPFLLLFAACASTTPTAQAGGAPTPEDPAPPAPTTMEKPADVVSGSGSSNSPTPTDELAATTDLGPIDAARDWIAGRYETKDRAQFAELVDAYSAGVVEVGNGYLGVGLDHVNGDVKVVASEDGFRWKQQPSPTGLPATSAWTGRSSTSISISP